MLYQEFSSKDLTLLIKRGGKKKEGGKKKTIVFNALGKYKNYFRAKLILNHRKGKQYTIFFFFFF